jgi:hypothetical protein
MNADLFWFYLWQSAFALKERHQRPVKRKPPGWAAFASLSASPSQPLAAPAPQEQDDDRQERASRSCAGRSVHSVLRLVVVHRRPHKRPGPSRWAALVCARVCGEIHLPNGLRPLPNNQGKEQVGQDDQYKGILLHHNPTGSRVGAIITQPARFVKRAALPPLYPGRIPKHTMALVRLGWAWTESTPTRPLVCRVTGSGTPSRSTQRPSASRSSHCTTG